MQCMQSLLVMLLLIGCTSGQSEGPPSQMDSRIDQAPMTAETKSYARGFFSRPNPKAFAFSPEKGVAWAAWGSSSLEVAKETAVRECEKRTGTECTLFAVDQQIVWQPAVEHPAPTASEDKLGPAHDEPKPVVRAPQTANSASASAVKPDGPTPAERFAVHVASVRNSAEVNGEWLRLAKRYQVLAGLEPQSPKQVEIPGTGIFYRVIGGEFTTSGQAQAVCEKVHSAGANCSVVGL